LLPSDLAQDRLQGTLNGLGERCGNANIVSIIPTLLFKKYFRDKFDISVEETKVKYLTECSRLLDEILNRKPNNHAAYVGASAFAHKGVFMFLLLKKIQKHTNILFQMSVGNKRNIVVSDQSGRSNILSRLEKLNIKINKDDPKVQKIIRTSQR
jgi:2-isopropylmalate synthase